jgi:hypothetical protein
MSKLIILIIIIICIAGFFYFKSPSINKESSITNFQECVDVGNSVMESYPRQCRSNGTTFFENIGNELDKIELIQIYYPRPNQIIGSPITVTGKARGTWFFEGVFPLILTDWDGKIIANGYASADGEWMTEDFVGFSGTLVYDIPSYGDNGNLILQKDNPSGLPEFDDALEIPIRFR